mgnify:CR=1 FL=1
MNIGFLNETETWDCAAKLYYSSGKILLINELMENGNSTISIMLMKLKLSLAVETPSELGNQIDIILELLNSDSK